jgi:hypothetical protein
MTTQAQRHTAGGTTHSLAYWGRLHLSSDTAPLENQDLGAVRINQNVAEVYAILVGEVMMHLLMLKSQNRPKSIAILYDSKIY